MMMHASLAAAVMVVGIALAQAQYVSFQRDPQGLPVFEVNASLQQDLASRAYFTHQVGNDRLVAMTTHGSFSLRQDEGGPKLLNDYWPSAGQYRAGVSWLSRAGHVLLTTHLPDNSSTADTAFNQWFGVGYYRKLTAAAAVGQVDETLTAPFGDWPVVEWSATVNAPAASAYTVNFGGRLVQLREGLTSATGFGSNVSTVTTRVATSTGAPAFLALQRPPAGCNCTRTGPCMDDCFPRPTFAVVLEGQLTSYTGSGLRFFGANSSVFQPAMLLQNSLDNNLLSDEGPGTAALSLQFALASPNVSRVRVLYGYLPEGTFENATAAQEALNVLLQAYQAAFPATVPLAAQNAALWRSTAIFAVDLPSLPWAADEVLWHSYNLRAMLTWDDYFQEHILNQAGEYIYENNAGFQGAARDPLAHAYGFTFTGDDDIYAGILRYTLRELRFCPAGLQCQMTDVGATCVESSGAGGAPRGDQMNATPVNPFRRVPCGVPWAVYAKGMDYSHFFPSDLEQWLLLSASQYVLNTRNISFLETSITAESGEVFTVREALQHLYMRFTTVIGFGEHGLCRLLYSDHNDGFLAQLAITNITLPVTVGESVMNSAMATRVLLKYAQLLNLMGDRALAIEVMATRAQLMTVLQSVAWNGTQGWYRRAYLGPGPDLGWVGDLGLWLEPNAWAVLGGLTDAHNLTEPLLATIEAHSRTPSMIGAVFSTEPRIRGRSYSGTWYCGNWVLLMALGSQRRGAQVLDEWRKNSLFTHRSVYPQFYEGQWSGPDVYYSVNGPVPGQSPIGYRLHNAWSHTTPIITLPDLVGLDMTDNGLILRPFLEEASFNISSHRFSLAKLTDGNTVHFICRLRFASVLAETLAVQFEAPTGNPEGTTVVVLVNGVATSASVAVLPSNEGIGVAFQLDVKPGEEVAFEVQLSGSPAATGL